MQREIEGEGEREREREERENRTAKPLIISFTF